MSMFDGYRFESLVGTINTKRKVSKKSLECMAYETVPPPEGHISFADGESVYVLGGSSCVMQAGWELAAQVKEICFKISDKDINIADIRQVKISGSTVPPLSGAAGFLLERKIIIFGGLNLSKYELFDEVIEISLQDLKGTRKRKPERTAIVTRHLSTPSPYPSVSAVTTVMTGDLPTARIGHSFTYTGNSSALLFGGLQRERTTTSYPRTEYMFKQVTDDKCLYIYDVCNRSWQTSAAVMPEGRAYHSSTYIRSTHRLFILGGLSAVGDTTTATFHPLSQAVVVDVDSNTTIFVNITGIPRDVFIQGHTATLTDTVLCIFGGTCQQQSICSVANVKETNNSLYFIDISSSPFQAVDQPTAAPKAFATHGHSAHFISNTLFFLGGTTHQLLVFTKVNTQADECALDQCKIANFHGSEVIWVACDYCDSWFHQFCLNMLSIPDQFVCDSKGCQERGRRKLYKLGPERAESSHAKGKGN